MSTSKKNVGRIIINNMAEGISDGMATRLVNQVIRYGKISTGRFGEQYCFLTVIPIDPLKNKFAVVTCELLRTGTNVFTITWEKTT